MLDMLLLVGTLFMGTELQNRVVIWNMSNYEVQTLYNPDNDLRII